MKMTELVEAMHLEYMRVNPYAAPLNQTEYDQRRDSWRCIICAGHELEDLRLVLKYLLFQVDWSDWNVSVLSFKSLIGNVDNFRNHLSMAKWVEARRAQKRADRPKPESQLAHGKWGKKEEAVDVKSSMRLVPKLIEEMRKAIDL